LKPGESADWVLHFDPTHHGTYGDHNHSVVLKSDDPDQPSLEIPTLANVVDGQ
jgi:hypothetical protein